MPTNKQRRQAAQRHLQRQLERRAEQARKRRRNILTGVVVLVVLVVGGAAALIAGLGGGSDGSASAASSSTAAAGTVDGGDGTCDFTAAAPGANPNLKDVGTPPAQVATSGTVTLTMTTDAGPIGLVLDRAKAPCASASFVYLAQQKFFDGSPCHREVNQPEFGVLQCGDPTGSGSGGPSYKFAQEIPSGTTYPRGTIAMANTGQPNSTGSQFFLCFTDTQLSPDYTPVGTVDEAGLAVLDTIAAAGNDGSFEAQAGGGAPNLPVTIKTMTVVG